MAVVTPQNLQDWSFTAEHMTMRGLHSQAGTDSTVVALHGFLDNANSVAHLAQAFPQSHFIAVDLAGHGHSDHRPAGSHYNQLDYVQDLHALISALPTSQVILLGHSLGGIIASIYAATFPEHVKAVVSIDAFGPLTEDEADTTSQIKQAVLSRAKKMTIASAPPADLDAAVAARVKMTDLAAEHCRHILARNLNLDAQPSVWRSDARLRTKSFLRMTPAQAKQLMTQIRCPFLVLAATDSFKQLTSVFSNRQDWVPHAQMEILAGGHHVHMEQKAQTINKIADFVSNL